MGRETSITLRDAILDAAEKVVVRQGTANLTLDAVASEAGLSKGGLLHHFPSKDRLVAGLVTRAAENWRGCYTDAYERTPPGRGRMARALLHHCLSDAECWTEELRRSTSAVFAALAQNPDLIEPMRTVYTDLHQRVSRDDLPPGIGETVLAAIDGLWLNWVLGLVPLDQARVIRVRRALAEMLSERLPERPRVAGARRSPRRSAARRTRPAPAKARKKGETR